MSDTATKELIFIGDPMCSWCWGFAPDLRTLRDNYADRVAFTAMVGGLRPGTDKVMDEEAKGYIRHHWEEVQAKTGQSFDFSLFERDDFYYDTEPACRAVVTTRNMTPKDSGAAFDMHEALHKAFYADNRDITQTGILTDIASETGLDAGDFGKHFESDDMQKATQVDFALSRRLGVTGFPTIIAKQTEADGESQYGYLTVGYRPYDAMQPLLEEWIRS